MSFNLWNELEKVLQDQLKPDGYCGHLLKHFDSKKSHLEQLIKQTATSSQSNSVLILGPEGSGKSALLECVLERVFKDRTISENMLQVWLHGQLHTDDNIALESITHQLGLRELEDKSLGSFSEKLRLLLEALKSGTKESKSVLFILDSFEEFTCHKNQTLLYNLFDITQTQQTPICIVGLSCRTDVLQELENRVSSRFSHQQILLCDYITLDEYLAAAKHFLSLNSFKDSKFQKRWNSEITSLLKETAVRNILEQHLCINMNLRELKNFLFLVILNLNESQLKLTIQHFEEAHEKYFESERSNLILGLSVLEVALVIAMAHLTDIYDGEAFNFEMVFNELEKFLRNRMKWNIEKSVVWKSFEHLLHMKLAKSSGDSSVDTLKNYMLVRLMVSPDEIKTVLEKYQNLPGELKNWLTSMN